MLHGEIKVNRNVIGTWQAERMDVRPDGAFTYDTIVTMNGTKSFAVIAHRYEDGAAILASKVLATAGVQKPPA